MSNQNREWLKARKRGIGGSDAAAVLGFSPWRTPVDVWIDKTSDETHEAENNALYIGTMLEDCCARLYEKETGRGVRRYNKMLQSGCLLGNLDRLVVPEGEKIASFKSEIRTDRLLECKTSIDYTWDEVPIYYEAQVQHYMGLCPSIQYADVAVIFKPSNGFRVYTITRNDEDIADMQEYLTDWWERYVVQNVAPPANTEADCRKIWAHSRGVEIVATHNISDVVAQLRGARESIALWKKREQSAKDTLAAFMRDADTLIDTTGEKILTYKTSKDRVSLNTDGYIAHLEALLGAENLDEIRQSYMITKPGARPFVLPKSH